MYWISCLCLLSTNKFIFTILWKLFNGALILNLSLSVKNGIIVINCCCWFISCGWRLFLLKQNHIRKIGSVLCVKWNCCFYAILLRKWTKTKNYQLNSYRLILYIHFCTKSSARFMWETDNEFNFLFLRIPCILNLLALPVNHFLCLCCLNSIQTRKKTITTTLNVCVCNIWNILHLAISLPPIYNAVRGRIECE